MHRLNFGSLLPFKLTAFQLVNFVTSKDQGLPEYVQKLKKKIKTSLFSFLSAVRPTATPTARGYEYVYATGSVAAVFCVSLIVVGVCVYLLIQQSKEEDDEKEPYSYADSVMFSRSRSDVTVSTAAHSRYSPDEYAAPYGRHYMAYQSQSEV